MRERPYDFTTEIPELQGLILVYFRVWIYALKYSLKRRLVVSYG